MFTYLFIGVLWALLDAYLGRFTEDEPKVDIERFLVQLALWPVCLVVTIYLGYTEYRDNR